MCMMKDVEPLAASRSRVLRSPSRIATKMKVANGHQPGNGKADLPHNNAERRLQQPATPTTKSDASDSGHRANRGGDPGH